MTETTATVGGSVTDVEMSFCWRTRVEHDGLAYLGLAAGDVAEAYACREMRQGDVVMVQRVDAPTEPPWAKPWIGTLGCLRIGRPDGRLELKAWTLQRCEGGGFLHLSGRTHTILGPVLYVIRAYDGETYRSFRVPRGQGIVFPGGVAEWAPAVQDGAS